MLYDAYNDSAGVTARFNLNVLVRINRELGGNFDISAFTHRSIYNRDRHRIVTDAVHGAGAMAMERGRWHWAFPAGAKLPPGMPAVDSGKYIVHWMQQSGKWVMVDDIWNSDTPLPSAPPPPPAPARRGR